MRVAAGVAHDQPAVAERIQPASDALTVLSHALERVSACEVRIDREPSVSRGARQSRSAECGNQTRLASASDAGSRRSDGHARSITVAQRIQHDLTHCRKLVHVLVPVEKVGSATEELLEAI